REGPENEAAEEKQEAQEARQLRSLARIDRKAAEQAALQAVSGTVKDAELGNENGYVVWEVEVAGDDGMLHEVKVDAGNGQILHQETGDEGSERGEANEANEPAETSGS
ncbi:MAG: PepSY domain-containing protein, partial [Actinomycetota bacterium]